MSRAFTKEIDDAPPPPLEERTMSMAPNLVTKRGAAQIQSEIDRLDAAIADATGDQQAGLSRDLRYWSARRATMQVVEATEHPAAVAFGTQVSIKRGGRVTTLSIVGEDEADPATGHIAWTSPLANALLEAEVGEVVSLSAGGRDEAIEVLEIRGLAN
ncbi:GreA/GreB family elongation factor [Devosia sp.]|jgi:transcription elongation GreA/GreB family factor|uniref:GreA/GreB family elongation factor n=1 Tax=Devosia sp. TaxID=1871048 RepID=UPI0037BE8CB1